MSDLVIAAREMRVLTLWHVDKKSTWGIALELQIPEEEVCRIIDEAEGRGEKVRARG